MKFFVLLYINSPVFEKQIKPAKNKLFYFPVLFFSEYGWEDIWAAWSIRDYVDPFTSNTQIRVTEILCQNLTFL